MAIKIKQAETFRWPVKVNIPKDGGGFEVATFDAVFKRMGRTEAEKLGNEVFAEKINGLDAVRAILVGWVGVVDDGQEVPFSETNREQLLEIPGAAISIFRVFNEAMSGAAQLKN